MAKQVNVPINYRVNTIEVDQAKQKVEQAQRATDQLAGAAQKMGTQVSQSFRFTSKAVEGMEIELARLKQQIKLTSVEDTKRLNELTNKYKQAKTQLDAYNRSLFQQTKETKAAAAASKDMAMQFNNVFGMVRGLIAAGLVRELINIQLAAAKLSGTVEGVEKAFNRIPNATILLHDLREATHGTVTDLELMQKALQAQNFRIPLQNLGTLLEFAAVKAQQTGQEVNHLVDYIVSGIGYRSIKRLDDLGFTANRVKEALGGVSLQAASMPQVMAAVTKLMNEDLAKTGGYAETAATKVKLIETAIHDLQVEASKRATSNGLLTFFESIIKTTTRLLKISYTYQDLLTALVNPVTAVAGIKARYDELQLQEQITAQAEKNASAFARNNDLLKEREKLINADSELFILAQKLNQYKELKKVSEQSLKDLEKQEKDIQFKAPFMKSEDETAIPKKIEQNKMLNESYSQTVKILSEQIAILADYRSSLTPLNNAIEDQVGLIDAVEAAISDMEEAIGKATNTDDIDRMNNSLLVLEATLKRLKGTGVDNKLDAFKISDKSNKETLTQQNKKFAKIYGDDLQKQLNDALANLVLVLPPPKQGTNLANTEWQDAWLETKQEVANMGLEITNNLIQSELQREVDGYRQRIDAVRNFYDEQQILAGDNQRVKAELRIKEDREIKKLEKERADREKKAAIAGIIVNTALGVAQVWAGGGTWQQKLLRSIIVSASGTAQLVMASRAKYYAKGEVDIKGGTPGKDSIQAMLMPGESVITTDKTKRSKNTLKMIHAGKLNDGVMRDILSGKSGGSTAMVFDDSKIVKELRSLKEATPDVVKRANMVYEVRKKGDNYKQYIRSKSMGY